jgi:amidase
MTPAEILALREYRQVTRPAGVAAWMDAGGADDLGVDAVVYPGLLSDISVNDGGGGKFAFGRRDTPSAQNGVPTIAIPAGFDDRGQPIDIQLMGRAWDDAKLVGFAYAFEHYAALAGSGHVVQTTAPPLRHDNRKSVMRAVGGRWPPAAEPGAPQPDSGARRPSPPTRYQR